MSLNSHPITYNSAPTTPESNKCLVGLTALTINLIIFTLIVYFVNKIFSLCKIVCPIDYRSGGSMPAGGQYKKQPLKFRNAYPSSFQQTEQKTQLNKETVAGWKKHGQIKSNRAFLSQKENIIAVPVTTNPIQTLFAHLKVIAKCRTQLRLPHPHSGL